MHIKIGYAKFNQYRNDLHVRDALHAKTHQCDRISVKQASCEISDI